MKAFLVKGIDKKFADTVIRASDFEDAKMLAAEIVRGGEIGEIPANVADSMGVPSARGHHEGALTRWLIGPTTLFGDLIHPSRLK
jgi:hypothetical protein